MYLFDATQDEVEFTLTTFQESMLRIAPRSDSSSSPTLLELPPEVLSQIVSYVCSSLSNISILKYTCKALYVHTQEESNWQHLIQSSVPFPLTTSHPLPTFQELYKSHSTHWFLPKYKLWFCDYFLTGKLMLVRYKPSTGYITGHRLVAERPSPTYHIWASELNVLVHSFNPKVRLHPDQPLLNLPPTILTTHIDLTQEFPMPIEDRNMAGIFSNFMLTRPVPALPGMRLWPPEHIPSAQRVRNISQEFFRGVGHKPTKRYEICETSFRIRRWMEMLPARQEPPGVHLGEEMYTYSTLDPALYTPTPTKPFRGIWVGDYSGHGCEFLLMHQPDSPIPVVEQREDETVDEFGQRKANAQIYNGSIHAIKLTGDPNIPRGEFTFICDDIGEGGYVRTANDAPFEGARIVNSKGHIANRMYQNGESPNTSFLKWRRKGINGVSRHIHRVTAHHRVAQPSCAILVG